MLILAGSDGGNDLGRVCDNLEDIVLDLLYVLARIPC